MVKFRVSIVIRDIGKYFPPQKHFSCLRRGFSTAEVPCFEETSSGMSRENKMSTSDQIDQRCLSSNAKQPVSLYPTGSASILLLTTRFSL